MSSVLPIFTWHLTQFEGVFGGTFMDISDGTIFYLQPLWLVGTSAKKAKSIAWPKPLKLVWFLKPILTVTSVWNTGETGDIYHCLLFIFLSLSLSLYLSLFYYLVIIFSLSTFLLLILRGMIWRKQEKSKGMWQRKCLKQNKKDGRSSQLQLTMFKWLFDRHGLWILKIAFLLNLLRTRLKCCKYKNSKWRIWYL